MPLNMNYYVLGFQNLLMEEIMSDKEEISKVIQTYIDGMNFSSAEKSCYLWVCNGYWSTFFDLTFK